MLLEAGGSLEDLWPFNEEITANAIYESEIPIISAVGHETDFTIADFVADLRAPTPSAAGELAVPDRNEVLWKLQNAKRRLALGLTKKVEGMRIRYQKVMQARVLKNPLDQFHEKSLALDHLIKNLEKTMQVEIQNRKIKLVKNVTALDALSPLKTLTRGYSMVEDEAGSLVKSVKQLKIGQEVKISLQDGEVKAKINEIQ